MVKHAYEASPNVTWLLIITPEGVDPSSTARKNSTMGGAVCVHPDGLLVSAARNLSPNCHVKARGFSDTAFRRLESLNIFPNFDLAIGWLSKSSPDESFPHVPLTDEVEVDPGAALFSHVHMGRLPFSSVFGYASYKLPKDVPLPELGSGVVPTLAALGKKDKKKRDRYQFAKYRAVGIFARSRRGGGESVDDLMGMHPDLPLIQCQGIGSALDSSGCPVFKEDGKQLIGLMSFSKSGCQWVIPIQMLFLFVQTVLGPIAAIVRPTPTPTASA